MRDRYTGQGPALAPNAQQQLSSLQSPLYARVDMTDASPMAVDIPQTPNSDEHWLLDGLVFQGKLAVSQPPAGSLASPVSGLFLVERGQIAVESLATAQAGDGVDMRARGVSLPILASIVPLANGGWEFAIFYNGPIGRTVPHGWTLRAIVNCNPGTVAPGPGSGSFGELVGIVKRERNYGA